jgi:hypothetical protein
MMNLSDMIALAKGAATRPGRREAIQTAEDLKALSKASKSQAVK